MRNTTPQEGVPADAATLPLLVADCQRALEDEIEAVQDDLARRGLEVPVSADGRHARDTNGGFVYRFHLAGARPRVRPDDRVRVRAGGRESHGVVTAVERRVGVVDVLVGTWFGKQVRDAELEFDPTWLLRELGARLESLAREPGRFFPSTALALLGRLPPSVGRRDLADVPAPRGMMYREVVGGESSASKGVTAGHVEELADLFALNPPQREALSRVLGSQTQLVWGPPGTGKTRLVAAAALALAAEGRVLVAAATNAAVDEAAARIRSHLDRQTIGAGRVVRVGGTRATDPALTLEGTVERRVASGAGGIERKLEEIAARLDARSAGATSEPGLRARIARMLAIAHGLDDQWSVRELGRLTGLMAREAVAALGEADVVLTTLARLAVREELRDLRYESVVLDEVSAASIPPVLLAASLARSRAVAVGDFRQLPPVVASDTPAARRWLRRDVFEESGVIDQGRELPAANDGLCSLLHVQYRMAPRIRELVSESFYGGRLEDAPAVSRRADDAHAVTFLDTTALDPRAEREGGSRHNPVHAEIVVDLLGRVARDGYADVAVVAPYRAQTRRVRELARARLGKAAPAGLEVSTIHRFQGREKAFVIVDTVDAPPGRSWFLDERRHPAFPRLLNVALSRARHGLVIVGTLDGLKRGLPADALLVRMLARLVAEGARVSLDHDIRFGLFDPR